MGMLTPAQKAFALEARSIAQDCFAPARALYSKCATPMERYTVVKDLYAQAIKRGTIKMFIPEKFGGGGADLLSICLMAEEFHAVDPSMSALLMSNVLGLSPVIVAGTPEQQEMCLRPFLSGEGTPGAVLALSEPGGTANWQYNGEGKGMQTRAVPDGDDYVLTGEKLWPSQAVGWDGKGPTVTFVVCRVGDGTGLLIVTREDLERNGPEALTIIHDVGPVGHEAVSGPHYRYNGVRVPKSNLLGGGKLTSQQLQDVVEDCFCQSAIMVAGFSVGLMRRAFEVGLKFARTDDRNGPFPIIGHQSVADHLTKCKLQMEMNRAFTWQAAATYMTTGNRELGYLVKISASEAALDVVVEASRAVGMLSYDTRMPYGDLLRDAHCMALFDGGNTGVRRRQMQALFMGENYDPREAAGLSGCSSAL